VQPGDLIQIRDGSGSDQVFEIASVNSTTLQLTSTYLGTTTKSQIYARKKNFVAWRGWSIEFCQQEVWQATLNDCSPYIRVNLVFPL